MNLPEDIIQKVHQDFETNEIEFVLNELNWRYTNNQKFWAVNVIRATLYLAKGNVQKMEDWLNTDDWSTILIHAEMKSGNYGHYFNPTFEEIERINEVMQDELKKQIQEQENLPLDLFEDSFNSYG